MSSLSEPSNSNKRTMPYVRLGNSGLKVSKVILGCMSYGTPEWQDWVLGEEESIEHIKAAYDPGINTFNTADVYSNGLSEIILGKAIKQHNLPRDEIVVMTKVFGVVGRQPGTNFLGRYPEADQFGYINQRGLSRKHIFASVKKSLERLNVEYIDVLQCYRFDPETPIEETMHALHDVVKAGYVKYIGMSSCYAWQCNCSNANHNLTPFISMENHYSLAYREEEREMFPTLKYFGVGSIPWSPLARGVITRPFSETASTTRSKTDKLIGWYEKGPLEQMVNRLEELAKKKGDGVTMAQIALAWVMSKDGVSAPVIGTTSIENLRSLVAATHIKLTEEIKYLEEPYKAQAIKGH